MKTIINIALICLLLFSCNSTNKKGITNQSVENKDTISSLERENELQNEIIKRKYDSTFNAILHTRYTIKDIETIKLDTTPCLFEPYMLIVSGNKLKIINSKTDSVFEFPIKKEIQTASWSPFNPREIFLLTREYKTLTDEETKILSTIDYKPQLFDLKLYRLNIDSLKMYGITTFYDYILSLVKFNSDLDFHPNPFLNIDKNKNLLIFGCNYCGSDIDDFGFYYYSIVNLKNRETHLDTAYTIGQGQSKLDFLKFYNHESFGEDKIKVKIAGKFVEVSEIPDNKPKIKIPSNLFVRKDLGNNTFEKQSYNFNVCFTSNNHKIIFSPYILADMDIKEGNLYVSDIDGNNVKILLKGQVLGDDATFLPQLNNGMYVIVGYKLYLYDNNFELIKEYSDYKYYELR